MLSQQGKSLNTRHKPESPTDKAEEFIAVSRVVIYYWFFSMGNKELRF